MELAFLLVNGLQPATTNLTKHDKTLPGTAKHMTLV
jgi:hypothetical protein